MLSLLVQLSAITHLQSLPYLGSRQLFLCPIPQLESQSYSQRQVPTIFIKPAVPDIEPCQQSQQLATACQLRMICVLEMCCPMVPWSCLLGNLRLHLLQILNKPQAMRVKQQLKPLRLI
jgi:hypothetical protein